MIAYENGNASEGEALIKSVNDINLYDVCINNDFTNMYETLHLAYHTVEEVDYLSIGPGVIMDIGYEMQRSTYNFEREDDYLSVLRQGMESQLAKYINARQTLTSTLAQINQEYSSYKTQYRFYLTQLETRVNAYKEENDLNE